MVGTRRNPEPEAAAPENRFLRELQTSLTISPPITGKRTRSAVESSGAETDRATKKTKIESRKTVPPAKTGKQKPTSSRSVNRGDPNSDQTFLANVIAELSELTPDPETAHAANIPLLLPFLKSMKVPTSEQVRRSTESKENDGEAPAAYSLTSAEARAFLASDREIDAPVLVANGAKQVFDSSDVRRPIQQALDDWFMDSNEQCVTVDASQPFGKIAADSNRKISELRQHFLPANGFVEYPWNLPDISNPQVMLAVPEFLQSMNCNLLHDIVRNVFDVSYQTSLCQDNCSNTKPAGTLCCHQDGHKMTVNEYTALAEAALLWRGTLMIADAGAMTQSHADRMSIGTWISCYEGEIGFSWWNHPSKKQILAHLENPRKITGDWLFTVLRPGQTIYMPPGTYHIVFRMPHGKQTLGMAGHILRRSTDADIWLRTLHVELQEVIKADVYETDDFYIHVVPPLIVALESILGLANGEPELSMLGGEQRIKAAKKQLKIVKADMAKMVRAWTRAKAKEAKASKDEAAKEAAEETAEEPVKKPAQKPATKSTKKTVKTAAKASGQKPAKVQKSSNKPAAKGRAKMAAKTKATGKGKK